MSYRLTPRQRVILEMLLNGYCNKEIAAKLGVAERTVRYHLGNVYRLLEVPPGAWRRKELVRRFGKFRVVWEPRE